MGSMSSFERTLGAIYDSLRPPASFGGCLGVVGTALKSHLSALHHEDFERDQHHADVVGCAGADDVLAMQAIYETSWGPRHNPWINAGLPTLLQRGFDFGDEHVPERELVRSPYYQHYLKCFDVRHGLGVCLWNDGPGKLAIASFNRSQAAGQYTKEERSLVARIHPHLVNAYAIHRRALALEQSNGSLQCMADDIPIGMFVMNVHGSVVEKNAYARSLLATSREVLIDRNGGLRLRSTSNAHFTRMLASLVAGPLHTCSIVLQSPAGDAAEGAVLHLHAVPAQGDAPRIVAFLSPFNRTYSDRMAMQLLVGVFRFTPAEASLAIALRSDFDVEATAAKLGISVTTARTHLQHMFQKTCTRKQAELLSLLERVLAGAPASTVFH